MSEAQPQKHTTSAEEIKATTESLPAAIASLNLTNSTTIAQDIMTSQVDVEGQPQAADEINLGGHQDLVDGAALCAILRSKLPSDSVDEPNKIINNLEGVDFTGVQRFRVSSTEDLQNVLEKIPISQLSDLRKLDLDLWRAKDEDEKQQIRWRLQKLIASLRHLENLIISCQDFQSILRVATVCRVGPTLRKLTMYDSYMNGIDPISVSDLRELNEYCQNIEELSLNLPMFPYYNVGGYPDRLTFEAEEFLNLLPKFANLKNVDLVTEHSLGTIDPKNSISTDPDYDDAEKIMKKLRADKLGVPFENIEITLYGAFRPRNWRSPNIPDGGGMNELNYWRPIRSFCSRINEEGQYEQWVEFGEGRVGDINESEYERATADKEYEEYLECVGDGEKKHTRPHFSPGMCVMFMAPSKEDEEKEKT